MRSSKFNLFYFSRPFDKKVFDVTPARKAAIKAQKVSKKGILEEITIKEETATYDLGEGLNKRKREETPVSTRSLRSKVVLEKTITPLSTKSVRSTRSKRIGEDNLNHFFEDDGDVIEDNVEQDTTWFTKIWKGVMSTVFFM